jgi:hypothetical protein
MVLIARLNRQRAAALTATFIAIALVCSACTLVRGTDYVDCPDVPPEVSQALADAAADVPRGVGRWEAVEVREDPGCNFAYFDTPSVSVRFEVMAETSKPLRRLIRLLESELVSLTTVQAIRCEDRWWTVQRQPPGWVVTSVRPVLESMAVVELVYREEKPPTSCPPPAQVLPIASPGE